MHASMYAQTCHLHNNVNALTRLRPQPGVGKYDTDGIYTCIHAQSSHLHNNVNAATERRKVLLSMTKYLYEYTGTSRLLTQGGKCADGAAEAWQEGVDEDAKCHRSQDYLQ
jgi:hypothetical protein